MVSKRRLLGLAGWIIAFASLGLFWIHFLNPRAGQPSLSETLASLDWRLVALGFVLFSVGHGLYLLLPIITHRALHYHLTLAHAYQYWFISQLAKYLPGGIWLIPARTSFYFKNGMPLLLAGTVVFWEVLSILAANLIFGLVIPHLGTIDALRAVPSIALILIGILIVSQMLWPWMLLRRLGLKSASKTHEAFVMLGPRRYTLLFVLTLTCLGIWLFIGSGFYLLLAAFNPNMPVSWWSAVTIYGIAWAIGFIVVLTPAGLGPREATVVLLLSPMLGPTIAFSAAILGRLAWTFGETIHIATAFLLQMRDARQQAGPRPPL